MNCSCVSSLITQDAKLRYGVRQRKTAELPHQEVGHIHKLPGGEPAINLLPLRVLRDHDRLVHREIHM